MIRELRGEELTSIFPKNETERKLVAFPFGFDRNHWVLETAGQVTGRISANRSTRDPSQGFIGFFELDPRLPDSEAMARMLIGTAENWLREGGVRTVHGPVQYQTLFDYRFRLPDPPGTPPAPVFFWEPSQPAEYPEWFKKAGYTALEEYHSRAYQHLDRILPKSSDRYEQALRLGYSFRAFDLKDHAARDLSALSRINTESFAQSPLAEPFDPVAYRELVVPRLSAYLSDFSFFILDPAGVEAGYFFLFEESGYLVWKTLAILPAYQGSGLAAFGIHHALTLAGQRGIDKVVSALIRSGAQSEHLLKRGEEFRLWEHRYAVFQKKLI